MKRNTASCQGPHHVILMEADCSGGSSAEGRKDLSKNVKIKIYRIIILLIVLCEC
jgi:hypothetical protein